MTEKTGVRRETADANHRRVTMSRPASFWLMAGIWALGVFVATAPSPLYRVYQAQLGFSTITLTVIFAVYAIAVLVTLLVFGSVSDYVGRRPVIVAALAVNMGGCALFLVAHSVGVLIAARVLQGVAVGAGDGALGAAMIDLQPSGSSLASVANSAGNSLGQGTGALCAALLAQYAPAPTQLIWWLLLALLAVAVVWVLVMPEPGTRRPGVLGSLRPRVGVPRPALAMFLIATPCLIAAFALSGFFLSLGPSLVLHIVGSSNLVWGGLVIFLLTGVAGVATVAAARVPARAALLAGCVLLFAGTAITFASIVTASGAGLLAGTAVAGVGFGLGFLGAVRVVSALAPPGQRAALVAALWIVNFLAFSVPALIAGWAVTRYGLHRTSLVYCVVIAALAAVAAASIVVRVRARSRARRAPATVSGS